MILSTILLAVSAPTFHDARVAYRECVFSTAERLMASEEPAEVVARAAAAACKEEAADMAPLGELPTKVHRQYMSVVDAVKSEIREEATLRVIEGRLEG